MAKCKAFLSPKRRFAAAVLLAVIIGIAWRSTAGPIVAPALLIAADLSGGGARAFAVAAVYFLAGSAGLPRGAAVFFGPHHLALGLLLWLASAFLLAAPYGWMKSGRWWAPPAALLAGALPPLGLIGWLSPLTAAGAWYPSLGFLGLGLLLGFSIAIARSATLPAMGLLVIALVSNLLYTAPSPPAGWQGVNTHEGPPKAVTSFLRGCTLWASVARASQATTVVLPEDAAGHWWPGTADCYVTATPPGKRLLVGAVIQPRPDQKQDVVLMVHAGRVEATSAMVFPVPVAMWRPGSASSYEAVWWPQPLRDVGKEKVVPIICYDQLLPWIWGEAALESPTLIVAVANDWWAAGTGITEVQRVSVWAWARLLGVPVISARNT